MTSNNNRRATRKVLVLCPAPTQKGGVAYFYRLIRKHFKSDRISLCFFYPGDNYGSSPVAGRLLKCAHNLLSLYKTMPGYDLIILNPSLDPKAVIRDGITHFVAKKMRRRRTLIFFHGWEPRLEQWIGRYAQRLFRFFFGSDKLVVLSESIARALESWGIAPESIHVETTAYEHVEREHGNDLFNLAFLGSLSREKGCLEAIKAVEIVAQEYPEAKLFMMGEGVFGDDLKRYARERQLTNIVFTGWLDGEEKESLLARCGILLFPSYTEGMPLCLLEAMGSGLVVVTRPVGGIPDIMRDRENGYLVESLDPHDFAGRLKDLFENRETWKAMSDNNRQLARKQFEIQIVTKRLEELYWSTVK